MTEQEAEAFGERLTRVWLPITVVKWKAKEARFGFVADLGNAVSFVCADILISSVVSAGARRIFTLKRSLDGRELSGHLRYDAGRLHSYDETLLFQQFADEWMPFFRRGCWLSGCPIEASAHERAEWLNGFTREEIEAWNLKI